MPTLHGNPMRVIEAGAVGVAIALALPAAATAPVPRIGSAFRNQPRSYFSPMAAWPASMKQCLSKFQPQAIGG